MNFVWILIGAGVIIMFGMVAYLSETDPIEVLEEDLIASARNRIELKINEKITEAISFELDPPAPSLEYEWVERIIQEVQTVLVDGRIETVIVNKTVTEKVLTTESQLLMELKDRQTGSTKLCKRGHQCDVYGTIELYDPETGLLLSPVGFHYQFFCVRSTDAVLNCNNYIGDSETIITYYDNTFKVTLVTDSGDPTGFYELFVSVDSKFKKPDGQPYRHEGVQQIEVVV